MGIEERELRVRSDLEVLEAKLEETVGSSAEAEQARAELNSRIAHLKGEYDSIVTEGQAEKGRVVAYITDVMNKTKDMCEQQRQRFESTSATLQELLDEQQPGCCGSSGVLKGSARANVEAQMKKLRAAEADNDVFEREMAERAEIAQGKWRDFLETLSTNESTTLELDLRHKHKSPEDFNKFLLDPPSLYRLSTALLSADVGGNQIAELTKPEKIHLDLPADLKAFKTPKQTEAIKAIEEQIKEKERKGELGTSRREEPLIDQLEAELKKWRDDQIMSRTASGLKWRDEGTAAPAGGTEIVKGAAQLCEALQGGKHELPRTSSRNSRLTTSARRTSSRWRAATTFDPTSRTAPASCSRTSIRSDGCRGCSRQARAPSGICTTRRTVWSARSRATSASRR